MIVDDLTFNDVQLYTHLIEIIMYLTRTHQMRSRFYLFSEDLISRIAQLLSAPQKHLKLSKLPPNDLASWLINPIVSLKFFRSCIGLQDEAYNSHFISHNHFSPILNIVYSTMPRDNLLNSACLDLFEFIRHNNIKPLIEHLVTTHRSRFQEINYVDTFQNLILRYEQMMAPPPAQDMTLFSNDGILPEERKGLVNGNRWHGVKEMDADQQAYFDTSDDDEEEEDDFESLPNKRPRPSRPPLTNGLSSSAISKSPLVDYPDDEEDDLALSSQSPPPAQPQPKLAPSPILQSQPPERLSEKRRRKEDEDEDELGKLSVATKRRISGSSPNSVNPVNNNVLRRKKSFFGSKDREPPPSEPDPGGEQPKKKIAISLGSSALKDTDTDEQLEEGGSKMEEDG